MEITWYGAGAVKFTSKDLTIIADPVGPGISKLPKQSAEVVTISHEAPKSEYAKIISGEPTVLDRPGEYEIKGAVINGIASTNNTIFTFALEELTICHLGGQKDKLNDKQLEAIGDVDILLVPIEGKTTINAEVAAAIVSELEPKIVIPIDFEADPSGLKHFVKEIGIVEPARESKLKIINRDLPVEEMRLVVLEQSKP